jgi:hypothetical protein
MNSARGSGNWRFTNCTGWGAGIAISHGCGSSQGRNALGASVVAWHNSSASRSSGDRIQNPRHLRPTEHRQDRRRPLPCPWAQSAWPRMTSGQNASSPLGRRARWQARWRGVPAPPGRPLWAAPTGRWVRSPAAGFRRTRRLEEAVVERPCGRFAGSGPDSNPNNSTMRDNWQ